MASTRSERRRRPTILIRAFEPSDAAALGALHVQPTTVGTLPSPHTSINDETLRQLATDPEVRRLVADVGGTVLGSCTIRILSRAPRRHVAKLELAFNPKLHGNELGRKLLEAACDLATKCHGIHRIEALARVNDEPSLTVFRESAFVIEGVARAYGLMDGHVVDAFFLARVSPELPWPHITAEDASRRQPPQLPSGNRKSGSGNGQGRSARWRVN